MRFLDVTFPDPEILVVLHGPLLVSAVQHAVGGVFHILPKALYGMIVPIHPVVVAVSTDDRRYDLHRLCYWFMHAFFEPCLGCLPFRLQFLLARADSQPILTRSCLGVEEGKSQKVKVLLRSLEPSYGQYLSIAMNGLKLPLHVAVNPLPAFARRQLVFVPSSKLPSCVAPRSFHESNPTLRTRILHPLLKAVYRFPPFLPISTIL